MLSVRVFNLCSTVLLSRRTALLEILLKSCWWATLLCITSSLVLTRLNWAVRLLRWLWMKALKAARLNLTSNFIRARVFMSCLVSQATLALTLLLLRWQKALTNLMRCLLSLMSAQMLRLFAAIQSVSSQLHHRQALLLKVHRSHLVSVQPPVLLNVSALILKRLSRASASLALTNGLTKKALTKMLPPRASPAFADLALLKSWARCILQESSPKMVKLTAKNQQSLLALKKMAAPSVIASLKT